MLDFVARLNLVQLFLQSAQAAHVRKMIVDLEVRLGDLYCIKFTVFLLTPTHISVGLHLCIPFRLLDLTRDVY